MSGNRKVRWLRAVAPLLSLAACAAASRQGSLTAADSAALRAVDSAYVHAWLADDTAAVMATLAPDAVLMPAGARPLTTPDAIRAFWWPQDGSHSRVTGYSTITDEIRGTDRLAYIRGRGQVSFVYDRDTVHVERTTRNMTLTLFERGSDNRWRISRRMWGALVP